MRSPRVLVVLGVGLCALLLLLRAPAPPTLQDETVSNESSSRALVIYAYQEADEVKRENLHYFLEHGVSKDFDCIIVCNGPCSMTKVGVTVISRENVGLDFAAWRAGLQSRALSSESLSIMPYLSS